MWESIPLDLRAVEFTSHSPPTKISALIFIRAHAQEGVSNRVDVCVQLQYSDRASINYYDVIIIIATIEKKFKSSVHKREVCVLLNSSSHFFYNREPPNYMIKIYTQKETDIIMRNSNGVIP